MKFALNGFGRWMRRHPILAAGIGVPAVFVAWILFPVLWVLVFGPPELIISRETTFITEPLDEDGLPDYVAAWNRRMGEGVTPENNAAAHLWEATGPVFGETSHRNSTPADAERIRRAQGFDPVPPTGDYLISGSSWIANELAPARSTLKPEDYERELDLFLEDVERLTQTPWRAGGHPEVAAWLDSNSLPLQTLREAVSLPDYFEPVIAEPLPSHSMTGGLRYFALSHDPNPLPVIRSVLATRICLHIGEGDFAEAHRELLTLHRVIHHWASRQTVIDVSRFHGAVFIEQEALRLHGLLSAAPGLPPELARQIRRDLEALGPAFPRDDGIELVDWSMRIGVLEVMIAIASGRLPPELLEFILYQEEIERVFEILKSMGIDWNTSLRYANRVFDDAIEILKEPDPLLRRQRLIDLDAELRPRSPADLGFRTLTALSGLKGRGRIVGWFLMMLCLEADFEGIDEMITDSESYHAVAVTGYALAEYKAVHGVYPERLDELAPEILETVPEDPQTAHSLVYVVSDDRQSMKVYSLGDNRLDDLGVNRTDPDALTRLADDLGIRTGEFAATVPVEPGISN
ncbi:hypothetical protein [Rubinisphaera margarita]|uniref:hypothetical protein n=1 Tax=Rubinisphaera margarita TaxID=2909586 RepID=UPI001EE8C67A|nr:hypothetical protein [Rubinisphaera margarita]MCG6154941.1 hypothetical protein [Rubinisphaera margarita]